MQSEAGLKNSFQSSIYDCVIDGMGAEHHAYLKQLLEQKNKAKGKHFQARSSANVL